MSPITLNLLSITLFVLVLTTLLGPLLHLSPDVPAIAVFVLLGLATVDRFGWQGQGGTLLVDWFAQRDSAHRDRVVYHEAGHFLVAHLLGIPVTGYSLTAWEAMRQGVPGQAGVRFADEQLQDELASGQLSSSLVDRYCQVWMAGGAAEKCQMGDVEGGVDDVVKLRSLLKQLKLSPQTIEQKERWAARQAQKLLEENGDRYTTLVAMMRQQASLEACLATLGTKGEA